MHLDLSENNCAVNNNNLKLINIYTGNKKYIFTD